MNHDADPPTGQRSASRDGLAAVAIILLSLALIAFVISALI